MSMLESTESEIRVQAYVCILLKWITKM